MSSAAAKIRVVTAGAGSGKTSRISREICRAVGEGGTAPERIIATTFTRKAAAELQSRIRSGLVEEGYFAESRSIGAAEIGTVHSVCGSLLRRYCYEVGSAPEITILSEQESKTLLSRSIGDTVSPETQGLLEKLSRAFGYNEAGPKGGPVHDWHDDVRKLIELARSNRISAVRLREDAEVSIDEILGFLPTPDRDYSGLHDEIRREITRALSHIPPEDGTKDTASAKRSLHRFVQRMNRGEALTWKELQTLSSLKTGAKSRDAVEPLSALASEHVKTREYGDTVAQYIRTVSTIAADTLELHTWRKREMAVMDFVDQEAVLLDALDVEEVRRRIRDEFSLLVVDEFQDTSPIQLAIFTKLAEIGLETVWVGDQKQSIYAFREADPQLMQAVVDALPINAPSEDAGSTDSESLGVSYRSRPELVAFANSLFLPAFETVMPDMPVALEANRPHNASFGTAVRFLTYPYERAFKKKEHYHAALAASIGEILDSALPVGGTGGGDMNGDGTRPVRLSDIAVLCRTNDNARSIADALSDAGIPAVLERPGLLSSPEGVLIIAALRYLADPRDSLAVAEILMLTDKKRGVDSIVEERIRFVREGRAGKWGEGNSVVAAVDAVRPELSAAGLRELFESVVVRGGLLRRLAEYGEPGRVYGNVEVFRRLIDEYVKVAARFSRPVDVAGFVRYMEKLADDGADFQAVPVDEDAVHVLTYHTAKGLEWPVVIPVDLDQKLKVPAFSIEMRERTAGFDPFDPLQGRSIRFWPDPKGGSKGFLKERIEESPVFERRRREAFAESCRLLYVGITRARDYLCIPVKRKAKGELDMEWFQALFGAGDGRLLELPEEEGEHGGLFQWRGQDIPVEVLQRSLADRALVRGSREEVVVSTRSRGEQEYPPYRMAASELASPPPAVSEQVQVYEYAAPLAAGAVEGSPGPVKDPAALGEAFHAVLLLAVGRRSEPDAAEAANILDHYGVSAVLDSEEVIRRSTAFLRWIESKWPNGRCELETTGYLKRGPRLTSARIDLLVVTDDEAVIIDHKTVAGAQDPSETARTYRPQLEAYRNIVTAALPGTPVRTMVHLPLQGKIVEIIRFED